MKKRDLLAGLGLAALTVPFSTMVFAASKPEVFTGLVEGVAAGGYDVVAYQTEDAAIVGNAEISAEYEGVTYRFSSAENMALFSADPAHYAPKYGGYCAYAVSQGHTAPIDPEAFNVVDGALYLNYSKEVRALWQSDVPKHIALADGHWPDVLN